jgi:HAD superfamily hydrolase (TIGR01484 family)
VLFTFCTGRSQPFVEALAQLIPISAPAICENGAVFYDWAADRIEISANVPRSFSRQRRAFLQALKREVPPSLKFQVESGKEVCLSLNSCSAEVSIPALYRAIAAIAPAADFSVTHSNSAVDVTPSGVTKGTAADELLARLGFSPADLFAIGDSSGDLPVLTKAGLSGCPANATYDVKQAVAHVAKRSHAAGVAELLQLVTDAAL